MTVVEAYVRRKSLCFAFSNFLLREKKRVQVEAIEAKLDFLRKKRFYAAGFKQTKRFFMNQCL